MDDSLALARVRAHLASLTRYPDGRPVGSAANHEAETYFATALRGGDERSNSSVLTASTGGWAQN